MPEPTAPLDAKRVFVGWVILCGIYLVRGRSLPASITAHAVTNALVWFPNLIIADDLLLH